MICAVVFSFIAYNIDLDKLEQVKIIHCETKRKDWSYTKPKNRVCGFNIINNKKYWYCYVKSN